MAFGSLASLGDSQANIVQQEFELELFTSTLFLFCGWRSETEIKKLTPQQYPLADRGAERGAVENP